MMQTFAYLAAILTLAMSLSGCYATGLSAREREGYHYSSYLYALYDTHLTDAEIQQAQAGTKRLKALAKLAVAQVGEVSPPRQMLDMLAKERQLFPVVEGIPSVREQQPGARDTDVSEETVQQQVSRMRLLAADLGMDYLFLFGGTIDLGESSTGAEILDWTIVGMYVIPSHKVHAMGRASGALVDIATGQVLFVVSAEEELKTRETTAKRTSGATDAYVAHIREQLIPKLTTAFLERAAQRSVMN